jgi:hypothetical protein
MFAGWPSSFQQQCYRIIIMEYAAMMGLSSEGDDATIRVLVED